MFRKSFKSLLVCAALSAPVIVRAQAVQPAEASPPSASAGLEDIIVTATRRSERLQDVAVAVTALSADALKTNQITDLESVQRATPNINIKPFVNDPTNVHISIRGPSFDDSLMTVDPPVGTYIDGVYVARGPGGNFGMLDMEQVEVLRGPQGTLFGRNTIGGAVNLIVAKPTYNTDGFVEAGYGSEDRFHAAAMINEPIIDDKLAFRAVYGHDQTDGFARSSITGLRLGNSDSDFGRASLKYDPAPGWDVIVSGDYTQLSTGPAWQTLTEVGPPATQYVAVVSNGMDTATRYINPYGRLLPTTSTGGVDATIYGVSGTITGDLGDDATVKSISSYRHINHMVGFQDIDSTPYAIAATVGEHLRQHQYSEELQLYGKTLGSNLEYIFGAYFFSETGEDFSAGRYLYPIFLPENSIGTDGFVTNQSYADYAQLSYSFTDKLKLTGGIRYSHDKRELTTDSQTTNLDNVVIACSPISPTVTPPNCYLNQTPAEYHYFPFTLGLDYKPISDILLYAKFSRGFRSGGFNLRGSTPGALLPFGPESNDTWEVGQKGEFFNNTLRINVDAFYSDYKQIQLSQNVRDSTGADTALISNAGTARIYGFEGEVSALLGPLTLNATVGLENAYYTQVDAGVPFVAVGDRLPETPKATLYLGADYKIPLNTTALNLHVDYDYKTRMVYAVPHDGYCFCSASYGTVNSVISANLSKRVELSIWGRNLLDKEYLQYIQDTSSIGFVVGMPGDPRSYGASVRYNF